MTGSHEVRGSSPLSSTKKRNSNRADHCISPIFFPSEASRHHLRLQKQMRERLGHRVTSRTSSIETSAAFKTNPDVGELVITDRLPRAADSRCRQWQVLNVNVY